MKEDDSRPGLALCLSDSVASQGAQVGVDPPPDGRAGRSPTSTSSPLASRDPRASSRSWSAQPGDALRSRPVAAATQPIAALSEKRRFARPPRRARKWVGELRKSTIPAPTTQSARHVWMSSMCCARSFARWRTPPERASRMRGYHAGDPGSLRSSRSPSRSTAPCPGGERFDEVGRGAAERQSRDHATDDCALRVRRIGPVARRGPGDSRCRGSMHPVDAASGDPFQHDPGLGGLRLIAIREALPPRRVRPTSRCARTVDVLSAWPSPPDSRAPWPVRSVRILTQSHLSFVRMRRSIQPRST